MATTTQVEPVTLSKEEILRYSRHLIMPEVGMDGQTKLKAAKVLCIGAGGLGSPLALYLAAAGVGTLGMVDFDVVDFTNLQRQIIHTTADVGRPKLDFGRGKNQGDQSRTSKCGRSRRGSPAPTRSTCSASSTSWWTAPTIFPPATW